VPQTSSTNRGCLDNSEPLRDGALTRDLHTHSRFSHALPLDIQKITPAQWTIEASVKPRHLRVGCQTFVVRSANQRLCRGTSEFSLCVSLRPTASLMLFFAQA
jgi:hypothetical protein